MVLHEKEDIDFGKIYDDYTAETEPLDIQICISSGLHEVIQIENKLKGNGLTFKNCVLNILNSNNIQVKLAIVENLASILENLIGPDYDDKNSKEVYYDEIFDLLVSLENTIATKKYYWRYHLLLIK
jgi:hypothetical protein